MRYIWNNVQSVSIAFASKFLWKFPRLVGNTTAEEKVGTYTKTL